MSISLYIYVATNSIQSVREYLSLNPESINQKDGEGRIPLYHTLRFNNKEMIDLLFSYKPDLTLIDKFGLSILDYAHYYDNGYVIQKIEEVEKEREREKEREKRNDKKNEYSNYKRFQKAFETYGNSFIFSLYQREEDD